MSNSQIPAEKALRLEVEIRAIENTAIIAKEFTAVLDPDEILVHVELLRQVLSDLFATTQE